MEVRAQEADLRRGSGAGAQERGSQVEDSGSALILVVGDLGSSLYSLELSLTLASRKHSSVLSTGSACLDVPEFLSF